MPTPKTEVHKPKTTTAAPTPAAHWQVSATEHGGPRSDSNTNNYENHK